MDIPLSSDQVINLAKSLDKNKKVDFYTYNELKNLSYPEESAAYIILFRESENFGHYTALIHRDDGILEFFDSYGEKPDREKEWYSHDVNKKLDQLDPYLCNIMRQFLDEQKNSLEFNEYEFQDDKDKSDQTCGRHVGFRIAMSDQPLYEYADMVETISEEFDLSIPELIVHLTDELMVNGAGAKVKKTKKYIKNKNNILEILKKLKKFKKGKKKGKDKSIKKKIKVPKSKSFNLKSIKEPKIKVKKEEEKLKLPEPRSTSRLNLQPRDLTGTFFFDPNNPFSKNNQFGNNVLNPYVQPVNLSNNPILNKYTDNFNKIQAVISQILDFEKNPRIASTRMKQIIEDLENDIKYLIEEINSPKDFSPKDFSLFGDIFKKYVYTINDLKRRVNQIRETENRKADYPERTLIRPDEIFPPSEEIPPPPSEPDLEEIPPSPPSEPDLEEIPPTPPSEPDLEEIPPPPPSEEVSAEEKKIIERYKGVINMYETVLNFYISESSKTNMNDIVNVKYFLNELELLAKKYIATSQKMAKQHDDHIISDNTYNYLLDITKILAENLMSTTDFLYNKRQILEKPQAIEQRRENEEITNLETELNQGLNNLQNTLSTPNSDDFLQKINEISVVIKTDINRHIESYEKELPFNKKIEDEYIKSFANLGKLTEMAIEELTKNKKLLSDENYLHYLGELNNYLGHINSTIQKLHYNKEVVTRESQLMEIIPYFNNQIRKLLESYKDNALDSTLYVMNIHFGENPEADNEVIDHYIEAVTDIQVNCESEINYLKRFENILSPVQYTNFKSSFEEIIRKCEIKIKELTDRKLGSGKKSGYGKSKVVSIAFDKSKWTKKNAAKWIENNGFKNIKIHETTNSYRFRQVPYKKNKQHAVKKLPDSIELTLEF